MNQNYPKTIKGEKEAFKNDRLLSLALYTFGFLKWARFLRKGPQLSENIMRSKSVISAVEKMKTKWGNKLYRADIGQPYDQDLEINEIIKSSIKKASDEVTGVNFMKYRNYTSFDGMMELKQAYADFQKSFWGIDVDPNAVLVGNGGSELMWATVGALFMPGDMILTPDPHYNPFNVYLEQAGVGWLPIKTDTKNGYHFNVEDVEKALKNKPRGANIKAIYLNSPNNPTGAVYTKQELDMLVNLAIRHNLLIITDDVYALYNSSDNPTFPQYLNELPSEKKQQVKNLLISLDSMSKLAHYPGARKGFAVIPNPQLRDYVGRVLGTRGNPDNFNQLAVLNILKSLTENSQPLDEIKKRYKEKMEKVYEKMKALQKLGFEIPEKIPEGNFYITIKAPFNTEEFLTWIADNYQGDSATTFTPIATKSGSFRADKKEQERAKTELRFCLGLDIEDIDPAIDAFVDQIKQYSNYLKKSD